MKGVLLIGTAVAALMGGSALAADMPLKARQAPAAISWNGFYVGVDAGYGWGDADWTFLTNNFYTATPGPNTAGVGFGLSPRGGLIGGHAGFNVQFNQFLLGVEGAYATTAIDDRVVGPVAAFPADSFHTHLKDLASVTARLGFVWGNALLYGKGGWATSNAQVDGVSGPPVPGVKFSATDRLNGWTVGGGFEWMLARNWIFGVEYNHYRLDSGTFNAVATPTATCLFYNPQTCAVPVGLDNVRLNTVTGRVSYKFGS